MNHIKNWRAVLITLLVAISSVAIKWYAYGRLDNPTYDMNSFHFGLIPWSDGGGWSGGAAEIMRGNLLTGYPAFRPLTPAYLALLFTLNGFSYYWTAVMQLFMLAIAIGITAWIMRDMKPRLAVIVFLASLLFWQTDQFSACVTEIPGSLVLLPGFALLLRGCQNNSRPDYGMGLFWFGLSQAIRPWNVAVLPLLPLLAFRTEGWNRRGAKLFMIYLLCTGLGFAFHQASCWLLNAPDAALGSYDKTVYGRVFGKNWYDYYFDPVIRSAMNDQSLSPAEFRKTIYVHIFKHLKEHPEDFLGSLWPTFKTYLVICNGNFSITPPALILLCLIAWPWRRLRESFMAAPYYNAALLILTATVLFNGLGWHWYCSLAVLLALLMLLRFAWRSRMTAMALLFIAGTLLSLPVVGNDGGGRVMISNDLMLFWLTGLGIAWAANRFAVPSAEPSSGTDWSRRHWYGLTASVTGAAVILLLLPWMIRINSHDRYPSFQATKADAQKIFKVSETPLDAHELDYIWSAWPQPSFELHRSQPAFWITRINTRDMIDFNAGEGVKSSIAPAQFWPLAVRAYKRTVLLRFIQPAVFPGISRNDLAQLEDRPVILFGRLAVKERYYPWATGFFLLVSRIAWRQDDGQWRTVKLINDGL